MIEQLKKCDLNCNIFSVYDYEELSIQELLSKFFTKINECVTLSNDVNDLARWLVNEGLKKEVADKLVLWLNNGTLENIINVNLFDNTAHKKDVYISVKSFGAKGDGVNDDTQFFIDAINEIGGEYSKGGTLFIPRGKYRITNTIFIPSNVNVLGEGRSTYFSSINDNIGTTILFDCNDIEKPCFSFIGKTNTGAYVYDYSVSGEELDNGVIKQTTSASLKNLTIYSSNNHNVGVVFSGAPLSTIEDVSIKGFLGGVVVSGNWGSVINRLFTQTLFFGVLTNFNTNNLQITNSYFDRLGSISSISSTNKLFNLVNSSDFLKPNTPSGIFARYAYNLKVTNTCIEHWENGIQTGGSSASTNFDGLWLEYNNQPITTQSSQHTFRNVYVYGVKDGNSVVLSGGNNLLLENIHGDYKKLFKDNYQRYAKVAIINCLDSGKLIQFLESEKLQDVVYVDSVNGNDYNLGNITMPVATLQKAYELVKNGGSIVLNSDIVIDYLYTMKNKDVTIKSDTTKRTISPIKSHDVIRQLQIENSHIVFENVNIDTFIDIASTSDTSYSAFLKPLSMFDNMITFNNCIINNKANYGILQHNHSKSNSYIRVNFCNTTINGDGAKSRNGYDSGILYVEEFSNGGSVDPRISTYDSSSVIINQY